MTKGKKFEENRILLPSMLSGASLEREFDVFCRRIGTRYDDLKRRQDASNAAVETANQWLRKTVYRCILPVLEDGEEQELRDLCSLQESKARKRKRGPRGSDTIFHVVIRAIFAHDMTLIGVHSRRRAAASLWWAFRHFVSVEGLDRFLARFPQETIENQSRSIKVEHHELEWVIIGLAEASDLADRGAYKKSIYDYVEKYQIAADAAVGSGDVSFNDQTDDHDEDWGMSGDRDDSGDWDDE